MHVEGIHNSWFYGTFNRGCDALTYALILVLRYMIQLQYNKVVSLALRMRRKHDYHTIRFSLGLRRRRKHDNSKYWYIKLKSISFLPFVEHPWSVLGYVVYRYNKTLYFNTVVPEYSVLIWD
jgi:hypothetical protein